MKLTIIHQRFIIKTDSFNRNTIKQGRYIELNYALRLTASSTGLPNFIKMKKVFLITIAILSFVITETKAQTSSKIKVVIHIEIGRTSKNCGGLGICKGSTIDVTLDKSGFTGIFNNNSGSSPLTCTIDKSTLDPNIYKKYMASGLFVVEENFTFTKEAGMLEGYTVKTGKYKITQNEQSVIINF